MIRRIDGSQAAPAAHTRATTTPMTGRRTALLSFTAPRGPRRWFAKGRRSRRLARMTRSRVCAGADLTTPPSSWPAASYPTSSPSLGQWSRSERSVRRFLAAASKTPRTWIFSRMRGRVRGGRSRCPRTPPSTKRTTPSHALATARQWSKCVLISSRARGGSSSSTGR